MACCLFVAFLIGQLFVFRDRVKQFFGIVTAEYNVDTDTVHRPSGATIARGGYRLAVIALLIALPFGMIAWHWHHILMWTGFEQTEHIANVLVKSELCLTAAK